MRSLHSTVKPFECGICDKKFSRMDALKRHVGRPGASCYQPEFLNNLNGGDEEDLSPVEKKGKQAEKEGEDDFDEFQIS